LRCRPTAELDPAIRRVPPSRAPGIRNSTSNLRLLRERVARSPPYLASGPSRRPRVRLRRDRVLLPATASGSSAAGDAVAQVCRRPWRTVCICRLAEQGRRSARAPGSVAVPRAKRDTRLGRPHRVRPFVERERPQLSRRLRVPTCVGCDSPAAGLHRSFRRRGRPYAPPTHGVEGLGESTGLCLKKQPRHGSSRVNHTTR